MASNSSGPHQNAVISADEKGEFADVSPHCHPMERRCQKRKENYQSQEMEHRSCSCHQMDLLQLSWVGQGISLIRPCQSPRMSWFWSKDGRFRDSKVLGRYMGWPPRETGVRYKGKV